MSSIWCGVTSDQCPYDNCDTCAVGEAWLQDQLRKKMQYKLAALEAEKNYMKALAENGEDANETIRAQFVKDACGRQIERTVKAVNQCPHCGRGHALYVNYCSACGQRLSWKEED